MSNTDHTPRQPSGRPTGGQFAKKHTSPSGLDLGGDSAVAHYLAGLDQQDRDLATTLLDSSHPDVTGHGDRQAAFDAYAQFGGFGGEQEEGWNDRVLTEVEAVAHTLRDARDERLNFTFDYSPDEGTLGYRAGAFIPKMGASVTVSRQFDEVTDDHEAAGMGAALGYARALDRAFDLAASKREQLRAPDRN